MASPNQPADQRGTDAQSELAAVHKRMKKLETQLRKMQDLMTIVATRTAGLLLLAALVTPYISVESDEGGDRTHRWLLSLPFTIFKDNRLNKLDKDDAFLGYVVVIALVALLFALSWCGAQMFTISPHQKKEVRLVTRVASWMLAICGSVVLAVVFFSSLAEYGGSHATVGPACWFLAFGALITCGLFIPEGSRSWLAGRR